MLGGEGILTIIQGRDRYGNKASLEEMAAGGTEAAIAIASTAALLKGPGRVPAAGSSNAAALESGANAAWWAKEFGQPPTIVLGKLKDLKHSGPGEMTLLDRLPNLGSARANWKQNAGVLRSAMKKGNPIRDASVDPLTGQMIDYPGSFLNMERNLLESRGWYYDDAGRQWIPPECQ
jgi:hypothetical protein